MKLFDKDEMETLKEALPHLHLSSRKSSYEPHLTGRRCYWWLRWGSGALFLMIICFLLSDRSTAAIAGTNLWSTKKISSPTVFFPACVLSIISALYFIRLGYSQIESGRWFGLFSFFCGIIFAWFGCFGIFIGPALYSIWQRA